VDTIANIVNGIEQKYAGRSIFPGRLQTLVCTMLSIELAGPGFGCTSPQHISNMRANWIPRSPKKQHNRNI